MVFDDAFWMRKYLILLSAVLMQTCLGATYSWSVFVDPIKEFWHFGQGRAQLPFTIFYVVFPAVAIAGGVLLGRLGLRRCAMLGGVCFGSGWLIASLGGRHFGFTVAGIGVVAGIGAGLAYLVPIQACVLWFPRHKALVTGIAVAGFGGGAALVAKIANKLMLNYHASPFMVLGVAGLTFLVLIPLAGFMMSRPTASTAPAAPLQIRRLIRQPLFPILYTAMIAGLAAGFAVSANMKQILPHSGSWFGSLGERAAAGVTAVALFAIGNAAGRILWGAFFDRRPGFTALVVNLLFQALLLLLLGPAMRSRFLFLSFALLTGFNYGGVLVLYASMSAQAWGVVSVGRIYGCMFSSNIIAACAPYIAGEGFDRLGSFAVPFTVVAVLMLAAAVLLALWGPAALRASSQVTEPLREQVSSSAVSS